MEKNVKVSFLIWMFCFYIDLGWVFFQKWFGFLSTDYYGISGWLILIIYAFLGDML